MGKLKLTEVFFMLLISVSTLQLEGQNAPLTKVEFLNAPVLFIEGNKSFQQVVASYHSEKVGRIVFTKNGKLLLKADMVRGNNRFLLTFPAVTRSAKITIAVKINDNPSVKYPMTLVPPKKWQIYFVQHSHTDIGYTRPQSEILAEHMRYIDYGCVIK